MTFAACEVTENGPIIEPGEQIRTYPRVVPYFDISPNMHARSDEAVGSNVAIVSI